MGIYRCHAYSLADKKKAVEEAAQTSVRATARKWCVQPCMIRAWRKRIAEKEVMPTNFHRKKTFGGKKSSLPAEAKQAIITHVEVAQARGIVCSTRLLRLNLLSKSLLDAQKPVSASNQQIRTFLHSAGYSYKKKTTSIPETRQCKMMCTSFVSYIVQQMMRFSIAPENTWNFDQTNIPYQYEQKKTIASKGHHQICKRGGKQPTQRASVMAGCNIAGKKSPPFLVWKGLTRGRISKALEEVNNQGACFDGTVFNGYTNFNRYAVNKTAWMNEALVLQWIELAWKHIAAAHPGPKMLILDDFAAHQCKSVYVELGKYETILEIIPGGLTGKLQVCICLLGFVCLSIKILSPLSKAL